MIELIEQLKATEFVSQPIWIVREMGGVSVMALATNVTCAGASAKALNEEYGIKFEVVGPIEGRTWLGADVVGCETPLS